jgi:hypothetical protein
MGGVAMKLLGGVLTFSEAGLELSDAVRFAERLGCDVRGAQPTADGELVVSVAFDQATGNAIAIKELDGLFQFEPDPELVRVAS